jgi:hypothetical protein
MQVTNWDKEYKKIQNLDKEKLLFTKSFPSICFSTLINFNKETNLHTDDGCSHYIDINNKKVYSYLFNSDKWMIHPEYYQTQIICLYEKNKKSSVI